MATHARSFSKGKAVPGFMQPNTVLSSRASIFGDSFDCPAPTRKTSQHVDVSRRGQDMDMDMDMDQDSEKNSDEEIDDKGSEVILAKLYDQLQDSIVIKDVDSEIQSAVDSEMKSVSAQGSKQGNNSNGWTEEEEEDQGLEFRLFASQDVPTAVLLTQKEPEIFHAVHRERPDLDESPGSERMQHIAEAVIDTATVLNQSRVPWPRAFFAHKVIHVPFKQKTESTQKTKKSRRKREWEKKVKAGLIDQATIEATSRKIKVSESWGRKPFLVRKGLDPNTIDAGTRKIMKKDYNSSMRGRGARGGGRGGRGMAARGRDYSGDRDREHGADIPSAIDKTTQTQHQQKTADQNSLYGTKKDNKSRVKEISEPSNSVDRKNKSTAQPASSKATALTALVMSATTRAEATQHGMIKALPKDSQAASLPKKLKSSKQPSKLDNIMAILTGK